MDHGPTDRGHTVRLAFSCCVVVGPHVMKTNKLMDQTDHGPVQNGPRRGFMTMDQTQIKILSCNTENSPTASDPFPLHNYPQSDCNSREGIQIVVVRLRGKTE
jgi:hypothetical protein